MSRRTINDINELKRAKLQDIIRRAIANPLMLAEAANQIAQDWHPVWSIDASGKASFVIGDGRKK